MLPHWEKMYAPFFEWILQQNFQAPQTRINLSEAYMDGRWKYRPRNYYAKPSDFLTARIMCTNYPVPTKAQLMFIMSIPMTDRRFYKELNKVGKFKMDRKGRLTEFKIRDGNVVFEGEHDQHQFWSQDQYMTREEEEKEEEEQEGEKEVLPIKKKRGAPNRRGRDSEPWNSGASNQDPNNVPVQANKVLAGGPDPEEDDVDQLEQDPDDVMMSSSKALTLGDNVRQNPRLDHGNENAMEEGDPAQNPEDIEIDETGNSESGDVNHRNLVLDNSLEQDDLDQELMETRNYHNQSTHLQDVPNYDYDPIPIATSPQEISGVPKSDEVTLQNIRDSDGYEEYQNQHKVCTPRPSTRLLRHSRTSIRLAGVNLRIGILDIIEEAEEKFEDQINEVAPSDASNLGESSDDVRDPEDLPESPKASDPVECTNKASDAVNAPAPSDQCHKGHSYCNGQDYQCYVKEQARRGKIQYAKNTTYYENLMRSIEEDEAKKKEEEEKRRFRVEQTKAREAQKKKEREARLARRSRIAEKAQTFDVVSFEASTSGSRYSRPSTSEGSTSRSSTSCIPI